MELLIIMPCLDGGGSERVLSILSKYFCSKSINVTFGLTLSNVIKYQLDERVKIIVNNNKKSAWGQIKFIRSLLKTKKYDYVLSFLTYQNVYTLIANIFLKQKIVISERNDPSKTFYRHKSIKYIRAIVYRKAYRIIFQTEDAKNYFGKKIQSKSVIISNPLDTSALPKWQGINSNSFMTACRLGAQKNIPMMINAMIKLHQEYPQYTLNIYGKGENEHFQNVINELNAQDYIFLMGPSSDIFNIMSNSFCFLLSSDYEGVSNSMLEALAIGVPSICTDCPVGGARLFIEHHVNGSLIDVKDVDAMAREMKYMVENKDKLLKISEEAMKVRDKISIDTIGSKWLEVFK